VPSKRNKKSKINVSKKKNQDQAIHVRISSDFKKMIDTYLEEKEIASLSDWIRMLILMHINLFSDHGLSQIREYQKFKDIIERGLSSGDM